MPGNSDTTTSLDSLLRRLDRLSEQERKLSNLALKHATDLVGDGEQRRIQEHTLTVTHLYHLELANLLAEAATAIRRRVH